MKRAREILHHRKPLKFIDESWKVARCEGNTVATLPSDNLHFAEIYECGKREKIESSEWLQWQREERYLSDEIYILHQKIQNHPQYSWETYWGIEEFPLDSVQQESTRLHSKPKCSE